MEILAMAALMGMAVAAGCATVAIVLSAGGGPEGGAARTALTVLDGSRPPRLAGFPLLVLAAASAAAIASAWLWGGDGNAMSPSRSPRRSPFSPGGPGPVMGGDGGRRILAPAFLSRQDAADTARRLRAPMRLFHFSEDAAIAAFEPRPLRVPVDRGPDRGWLNGPLVWATDEAHAILYLFPRECPRIVIWPTAETSAEDREAWFGGRPARAIAYVEDAWLGRLRSTALQRYAMPADTFEDIDDAGMWVSRRRVVPLGRDVLTDLPAGLEAAGVELRSLPRLSPLKPVWRTTLHASGIRTRNAQDWGPPGWSHSKPGRVVVP